MPVTESLLLDTHVWIWLMEDSAQLNAALVERIDLAAQNHRLFVSAISVWEIATLASKGRLRFPVPVEHWVEAALRQPGLRLIPLHPAISIESAYLPNLHGDPADRILVASARLEKLRLVTRDRRILEWTSQFGLVHVLPA